MITIKEIAPYLPYNIKAKYKNNTIEILGIKNYTPWSQQLVIQISRELWTYGYEIKPILRPLSDLTNEIVINGKKFVPLNKLEIDSCSVVINHVTMRPAIYLNDSEFIHSMDIYENIFQKLFEWHFDIYGLIERGDAIDINTLSHE